MCVLHSVDISRMAFRYVADRTQIAPSVEWLPPAGDPASGAVGRQLQAAAEIGPQRLQVCPTHRARHDSAASITTIYWFLNLGRRSRRVRL